MTRTGACFPRLDRWLGLSAAMILMACAGLTYTYAVYSEHMKQRLHFSQEQVDDIGAAKDFGGVVGLLSGVLYNCYPPWATIGIGALLHLYGYSMVWMTLAGKVAPSFWLLCMYSAVGTGGDGWIDTACMMTSLQNYEEHRGTAMGILKAQLGLSSAIFVMIYEVLLQPDVDEFLLLMALVPTIASIMLAYFIRPFTQKKDEENNPVHRFRMTFVSVVILGVYLMFSMTLKEYFNLNKAFQLLIVTVMLAMMITMYLIPVLHIPPGFLYEQLGKISSTEVIELPKLHKKTSEVLEAAEDEELELLKLASTVPDTDGDNLQPNVLLGSHVTAHLTLRNCVVNYNFWLISMVVGIGAGTGVAIINNFAQIGKALRADGTDLYVGLISIWSCFGRLGAGYGSDYLLRRGFPRPICLLVTQIVMAFCCLLLATGLLPFLFVGSALTGLSYGAYWTLVPAILSEVFGLQNFAVLYKLVSLGPLVGSYLLSAKVVGYLYDKETAWYHEHSRTTAVIPSEDNTCYGRKCFGFGLLVLSFISMVGASASFLLFLGTRKMYHKTKQVTTLDNLEVPNGELS